MKLCNKEELDTKRPSTFHVEGCFVLAHLYYTISLFPVATTYTTVYRESGKLYYLALVTYCTTWKDVNTVHYIYRESGKLYYLSLVMYCTTWKDVLY